MLAVGELKQLVKDCYFPGLTINLGGDLGHFYLQVRNAEWTGRKWLLSQHMTRGEIIQTALRAVLDWHEHEAREQFTYRGKSIFSPHLSLQTLLDRAENIEVRK